MVAARRSRPGKKSFPAWKFSNAERMIRVKDGWRVWLLPPPPSPAVTPGSQEDAKKTGQRREEGMGVPTMCQAPAETSRLISPSEQSHKESGRPNS